MDDRELGMARDHHVKYPVLLWPYRHKDAKELLQVFVHECVHYAHPELEANEGSVEAVTAKLLRNSGFVAICEYRILSAMLKAIQRLFGKGAEYSIG